MLSLKDTKSIRLTQKVKKLIWIHNCVSNWLAMTKTSALRIRMEPELHQKFIETCKAQDVKASQLLREFMRNYVEQNAAGKQTQLFQEGKR